MYSNTRIRKLISKLADTEVKLLKAEETIAELEAKLNTTDSKVALIEEDLKVEVINDFVR